MKTLLHNCALAAATVLVFVHLKALHVVVAGTAAAGVRRHVSVVSPDFANNVEEGVVDVDTGPGGCLDEFAAKSTCECGTLCLFVSKWPHCEIYSACPRDMQRVACTWANVLTLEV